MNLATHSIKETCIKDPTISASANKSASQMYTLRVSKKIETQLCAAAGKAGCQNDSEVCSVYGRYGTGLKNETPIPTIPLLNGLVKFSYCFHLTHLQISGLIQIRIKERLPSGMDYAFEGKLQETTEFSLGSSW